MKRHKRIALRALDAGAAVLAYPAGLLLRVIRSIGVERLPLARAALRRARVFPIRDHYYEPQFNYDHARTAHERALPGIDWNVSEQLALLSSLTYGQELSDWPRQQPREQRFYLDNDTFEAGDAEFWYQLIRHKKPRRIYEIGSGNSTLIAVDAIRRNHDDDAAYTCQHVCVEPYEAPWLETLGVRVVREKVEDLEPALFSELSTNDILFIDSSHMIRPHGDVLFEYLELLPSLQAGVIVHIHDIFSPRNYPRTWLTDMVRFWNEQYLVEAFLTHNASWKVIAALNYLHHSHFQRLRAVAPFLTEEREPGSLYIQKVVVEGA